MSAKKGEHTDESLLLARQYERRKNSRAEIYSVAGKIAATLLTRINAAEVMDKEAIQALADKVVMEASIMALCLWDEIDDQIEDGPGRPPNE
jgi:hypothetical protein